MIFGEEPRTGFGAIVTRHEDGSETMEWGDNRVIAVNFYDIWPNDAPPKISDRRVLCDHPVRVIAENWMGAYFYVVPDDRRAPLDVLRWRVQRRLFRAEIKVIHALRRRGWIATKELEVFQWRDALPFALMRWR